MEDKVIKETLNTIKDIIDQHQDNLLEKSALELFFNSLFILFISMPIIIIMLIVVSFLLISSVLLFSAVNVIVSLFKLIKSLLFKG